MGDMKKRLKKTGAPFHSSPSLFNSIQITSKCLTYFTFSISILITKCVISMTAKFYFHKSLLNKSEKILTDLCNRNIKKQKKQKQSNLSITISINKYIFAAHHIIYVNSISRLSASLMNFSTKDLQYKGEKIYSR